VGGCTTFRLTSRTGVDTLDEERIRSRALKIDSARGGRTEHQERRGTRRGKGQRHLPQTERSNMSKDNKKKDEESSKRLTAGHSEPFSIIGSI